MRRGIAAGRDDAKRLIGSGGVSVDGSSLVKPATLVSEAAAIEVASTEVRWASRAGLKLDHALSRFDLEVAGARALDVGASTGGFTDVLLARGVGSVTAIDVGYGQMVWRLSTDERVTVVDRTNFRTIEPASLGPPFEVVVVDVSFISVRLLATQLGAVGSATADYVVLVKPQFEVGKGSVGRGGIVTDPTAQVTAIGAVTAALANSGIGAIALTASPIKGSKGNREFLLHARRGTPSALDQDSIDAEVRP